MGAGGDFVLARILLDIQTRLAGSRLMLILKAGLKDLTSELQDWASATRSGCYANQIHMKT
jgi:hypothetical protein